MTRVEKPLVDIGSWCEPADTGWLWQVVARETDSGVDGDTEPGATGKTIAMSGSGD